VDGAGHLVDILPTRTLRADGGELDLVFQQGDQRFRHARLRGWSSPIFVQSARTLLARSGNLPGPIGLHLTHQFF
jgi:hypothetical protein